MNESDYPLDALQIIIDTALRFDSYKYIEDTGYEPSEQIEKRMHDEPTQWDDLQRMVVFSTYNGHYANGTLFTNRVTESTGAFLGRCSSSW